MPPHLHMPVNSANYHLSRGFINAVPNRTLKVHKNKIHCCWVLTDYSIGSWIMGKYEQYWNSPTTSTKPLSIRSVFNEKLKRGGGKGEVVHVHTVKAYRGSRDTYRSTHS